MAQRLLNLIAWIKPYEWLLIILLGLPMAIWVILIFPPIIGTIVVVACVTTGTCLALLAGYLRQKTPIDSGRSALKLALLLMFITVMYDLHVIDFGCVDPGGVWDWHHMVCKFE